VHLRHQFPDEHHANVQLEAVAFAPPPQLHATLDFARKGQPCTWQHPLLNRGSFNASLAFTSAKVSLDM
jgi:hypothetical protein